MPAMHRPTNVPETKANLSNEHSSFVQSGDFVVVGVTFVVSLDGFSVVVVPRVVESGFLVVVGASVVGVVTVVPSSTA